MSKKVHKVDAISMPLPNAVDIECAFLGSLMFYPDATQYIKIVNSPDMMYSDNNAKVYKAILDIVEKDISPDILLVTEQLKLNGHLNLIGGAYYVSQLTSRVTNVNNTENYARIIYEKHIQRKLIEFSYNIQKKSFDETYDLFDIVDEADKEMSEINVLLKITNNKIDSNSVVNNLEKDFSEGQTEEVKHYYETGWSKFDDKVAICKNKIILVAASKKHGKCFAKGTPILMSNGEVKNIEDIKVGDEVMGADNTYKKVMNLVRGESMMYKIEQSKGMSYTVNEDHILSVKSVHDSTCRYRWKEDYSGKITNLTVKEYISKSKSWKSYHKGYKAISFYKNKKLSIDPYWLGLWLGDGNSADSGITTADPEILDYINYHAFANCMNVKKLSQSKGKARTYLTTDKGGKSGGIQRILRKINLIKNKHIPKDYLINSRQNRLLLLAGLIDSDGHKASSRNGYLEGYEIIQKRKDLAYDIIKLSNSLGFITKMSTKIAMCNGKDCGTVYRISIKGKVWVIPCRIKRKITKNPNDTKDRDLSTLKVSQVGIDNYYGISLDSEDQRFLLKDGTVVHNSKWVLSLMTRLLERHKDVSIDWITLEDSATDIGYGYLSQKVFMTTEDLRKRSVVKNDKQKQIIKKYIDKFKSFDIEFTEESIKINDAKDHFINFCKKRPGRFNILIIDNILSMDDRDDKNNGVSIDDYIMGVVLKIRQKTKGLIIPIHHFKDAKEDRTLIKTGYRPTLSDTKGSEAFSRVPNQVLLFNNPRKHKDLIAEYQGETKELLKHLFLIDVGANRNSSNDDEDALLRYYCNLDFNMFEEI